MMKPITVLSLFDGISCGQQALHELGIPVKKYYSSEIHLSSMQITAKNFPETKFLGDVTLIKPKYLDKIDLLIGGSPCQGFSFAGKLLNFEDPRSKLFFEYVRILKEVRKINPKVLFLLENVRMQKQSEEVITKALGVEPIFIDSKIFGPQMRKRLYWTNIKITDELPKKNDQVLGDVLLKTPEYKETTKRKRRGLTFFYASTNNVLPLTSKVPCLTVHGATTSLFIATSFKSCRALHPIEHERIQGLPDNYTLAKGASYNQRLQNIGNAWHVPTVKFILKHLNKKQL